MIKQFYILTGITIFERVYPFFFAQNAEMVKILESNKTAKMMKILKSNQTVKIAKLINSSYVQNCTYNTHIFQHFNSFLQRFRRKYDQFCLILRIHQFYNFNSFIGFGIFVVLAFLLDFRIFIISALCAKKKG